MTITLKPLTAAILIFAIGALTGLALGQVTRAASAPTAQTAAPKAKQSAASIKSIVRAIQGTNLAIGETNSKLGATFLPNTALDLLDDIKQNTGQTCRAVGGTGCAPF